MRRRLALLALLCCSTALVVVGQAAPASAASTPVRVGTDQCGNFQIWVNGNPTIEYFVCNGA
jgi:hypothetical protein